MSANDRDKSGVPPRAGLYIVATPIGNLGDLSVRASDMLRAVSFVACEDTRVTGKLLNHIGADTPMLRYDDHANDAVRTRIIETAKTQPVALVSDAGTPLISDPGYRLVREARDEGVAITSIPGACAAITALTLSGLPSHAFMFAGFLPTKDKARRDLLQSYGEIEASLIFYESGPRLVKTLAAIAGLWPERDIAVARELTKLHEECRTGTADELAEHYRVHPPRGEIVLLIGPPAEGSAAMDDTEVTAMLTEALKTMKPSKAAAAIAKISGRERAELYHMALKIRDQGTDEGAGK